VLMHLKAAGSNWLRSLRARMGDGGTAWTEAAVYSTMLWLILLNSGTPGEFIYFQF
jgi:hypothetical protein